jgi:phosphatidylglycerophosphate synthase
MSLREHAPLITSFQETVQNWDKMEPGQKLGATAALIVTTARPVFRALHESQRGNNQETTPPQLIMDIALDVSDKLDGTIARSADGVTPLGKELDPFMDKIDFLIQEAAQYRRGTLPLGHVAVRLARDVIVTLLRSHVNAATHGQVDISAGWQGKASTFGRLASLRMTGLPGEHDHPIVRSTHQSIATGLVIASGALNAKKLLDAKAAYLKSTTT